MQIVTACLQRDAQRVEQCSGKSFFAGFSQSNTRLSLHGQVQVNGLALALGKEQSFIFWKRLQAVGSAAFNL